MNIEKYITEWERKTPPSHEQFMAELRETLERVKREAIEETISYIGHNEGWEESEDFYRVHFGLQPKYKK